MKGQTIGSEVSLAMRNAIAKPAAGDVRKTLLLKFEDGRRPYGVTDAQRINVGGGDGTPNEKGQALKPLLLGNAGPSVSSSS